MKKRSHGRDLIIKQFVHLPVALVETCSLVGEQICSKKNWLTTKTLLLLLSGKE
jgi:hypothetical protein